MITLLTHAGGFLAGLSPVGLGNCEAFASFLEDPSKRDSLLLVDGEDVVAVCQRVGACAPLPKAPVSIEVSGNLSSGLDLRVTPVLGAKGYAFVRLSLISNSSTPPPPSKLFTYSAPFKRKPA